MGELGWAGAFGRGTWVPGGGNAHGSEATCRGGEAAGTPLTPVCYSTDQVKGVLTLQGDALSQAVSPRGPIP